MSIRSEFQQLVREQSARTGFTMPWQLEQYLIDLLADRLEKVDIIPEPSFGERYLELYHRPRISDLKDYADQCLFFTSLLPEYGRRRGLNLEYYATLGISVYYTAGDLAPDPRFTQLGNWFYHLQRFLNATIRPDVELELVKILPEPDKYF
jgi:hypothetical protein